MAPQKAWGWPPQPELDRGPCSVEVLPDGALRMKGTPSPAAGVRLDRLLRLDPEGTRLTIEQTMTCVADTPVTWAVWDVTQVASEGTVVIPLGPDSHARFEPGPAPTADWRRLADAYLVGSPHGAQKVFVTGGPGWLACRCGDRLLLKSFDVRRARHPSRRRRARSGSARRGFIELEFVGPQVTLEPGQATSLTQEWRCFPLGPDAATDEGLLREVRKAAEATGL